MKIEDKFEYLEAVLPTEAPLFNSYVYQLNEDNTITRFINHIDRDHNRSMLDSGEIIGHIDSLYEKYRLQIKKLVDEESKENREIIGSKCKTIQKQYYSEEEVDSLIESIRSQFSFNIRQTILQLYHEYKK